MYMITRYVCHECIYPTCPTTSNPDPPHICAVTGGLHAGSVVCHRRTSVAEEIPSLRPSVVLLHFTADHSRYS